MVKSTTRCQIPVRVTLRGDEIPRLAARIGHSLNRRSAGTHQHRDDDHHDDPVRDELPLIVQQEQMCDIISVNERTTAR